MRSTLFTALAALGLIWSCSVLADHTGDQKEKTDAQTIPSRDEAVRIAVATTASFAKAVKANDLESFYLSTSPEFQNDVSFAKFESAHVAFVENHADLTAVENVVPLLNADPSTTPRGRLRLNGYFLLTNGRVNFAYEYVYRVSTWKLAGMHVVAAPVADKGASSIVAALREKAEHGDAAAQFNLGLRLHEGFGTPRDDAEAASWYRKAAEQGYPNAQLTLGYMFANGEGVAKDDTKAVNWYRKAAENGNAHAQHYLGLMIYSGRGVAENWAEAAVWFRKAAEQGDADAQTIYGLALEFGRGVPKDETEAVSWYRKAAAQGDADARKRLDEITAHGHGGKN